MDVSPVLQELATLLPAERIAELRKDLAVYLNDLLLHDFAALVQLLYRVDVSEKKLKAVLQAFPEEDAGTLLADLIIQRQQEKYRLRSSSSSSGVIPDEEKW